MVFSFSVLSAQSVGLVLSGGGSKGLAHIGVIKALEECGIPIDYIGGTSMGAIIGGCYAMGLSTDSIISIIRSEEFNYWMSGEFEQKDRYYFVQADPAPDVIRIGLDINDTVATTRFPLSVIPNHLMDFAFLEIYTGASAAAAYNFDSLFVPFLCNGSDISYNREVVFRSGDLAQAVRASMTFPLYFRPIVIDSSIMYDGGIYNNFPIQHVREAFNPDVIIGSKAAEENKPPSEFDIPKQIENMVMHPADYHIEPGEGVLIDMKFENVSLLDFDRIDEFVELGYRSTMEKMDSIRGLVQRMGPDSIELSQRRKEFTESIPDLYFNEVQIDGLDEDQARYVKSSVHHSDSILSLDQIKREYIKLANNKSLSYLYPRAEYKPEDSLYRFKIRLVPQTPLEGCFGLHISTTGMAQTHLGFSYREISELSTHFQGSLQFGRFYNGVHLGVRFDYPSRTPVYVKAGFNYNGFQYNTFTTNFLFEDLKPPYISEDELNFRLESGIPYKQSGVLKAGTAFGRNQEIYYMDQNFLSTDTSELSVIYKASVFLANERNTYNNKQFATRGYRHIHLIRAGYGHETYYPGTTAQSVVTERTAYYWISFLFENQGYVPMSRSFSLGYHFQAMATFKPLLSNYYSSIIEAPVFNPNIVSQGLFLEGYRAHHFLAAGLMPVYKISNQLHAKLEGYTFFPLQEILRSEQDEAYYGNYFKKMNFMLNASLTLISVMGPVSLNMGYISDETYPWIFQLSYGYLLFNKKSDD